MHFRKVFFSALAVLGLSLLSPLGARADVAGDTFSVTYLFPSQSSVFSSPGTFTAPGGGNDGTIGYTITASAITFTLVANEPSVHFTSSLYGSPASFNGYTFTDLTGPTGINGITLEGSPSGFSSSDASFDAGSLTFNFVGLTLYQGESVTFDLSFADPPAATPEPSSLAMLGTGVLMMAGVLRRRFVS